MGTEKNVPKLYDSPKELSMFAWYIYELFKQHLAFKNIYKSV